MFDAFSALRRFLDEQFDAPAPGKVPGAAHHRRLLGFGFALGFAGFAAFPVWLAAGMPGGAFAAGSFFWLLAPLAISLFLLKTRRLAAASLMLTGSGAGLVLWLAAMTGGVASPLVAWLPVVLLTTTVPARRMAGLGRVGILAAGLAILAVVEPASLPIPAATAPAGWAILTIIAAMACLAAIANRASTVAPRDAANAIGFGDLADAAPDLLTRHDGAGRVTHVSAAGAERVAGTAAARLLDDGLFRLVHVADRPSYLMALSGALRGDADASAEYRLRRSAPGAPERYASVETCWRRVVEVKGSLVAAIGVTRDISVRKGAVEAEDLAKSAAAGEEAARRVAKASHEVRTPLNAIIGFAEILSADVPGGIDTEGRNGHARLICSSAKHLRDVANDLLDTAACELAPPRRQRVEIAPLIDECVEWLRPDAARRGVAIEQRLAADEAEIDGDPRAIKQIVLNLLSNAVKFSRPDGAVLVSVAEESGAVAIRVEDQGLEIAAEDLPMLGSPFFRIDSAYNRVSESAGLGLSVVKELVALHRGEVRIASRPGRGTTVTVTFPLAGGSKRTERGAWEQAYGERKSA